MPYLRREGQLWVVRPLEPDSVRLGVVRHGQRQGSLLIDVTVAKLHQVGLGSCRENTPAGYSTHLEQFFNPFHIIVYVSLSFFQAYSQGIFLCDSDKIIQFIKCDNDQFNPMVFCLPTKLKTCINTYVLGTKRNFIPSISTQMKHL